MSPDAPQGERLSVSPQEARQALALSAAFTPTSDPDRFLLDGGYVVLVRPDHPCAGPKGTVLEHRMVLYDAGLDPAGFDVHHKNGDRGDNRLENLELIAHEDHARRHMIARHTGRLEHRGKAAGVNGLTAPVSGDEA